MNFTHQKVNNIFIQSKVIMSQIENLQQNGETPCPLCDDPERKCNYKFPSFDDFVEFIYGDHYNGGAGVKPENDAHIRRELKKMFEN